MLFNSYIFFIFLAIVLPVFYGIKNQSWKKIWILLSSLFFYAYWDWRFLGLLLFSIITTYFLGKKIAQNESQAKKWLILGILINVLILGFFKYYGFFIDSFARFSQNLGVSVDFLHLNIILPIGISFYTFQSIAYLVDVYKKECSAQYTFLDFSLFISFFPQLVAGPIERAHRILPQFEQKLLPTKTQIKEGIYLIVIGLFQKVMIGDACGRIVDAVFLDFKHYASFEIISATLLFSIQIYADFAGYSNMARGVAKLMGIDLMINFKQPYGSVNISEFWKRWHISLSTWLRDYIYIPLGGNRNGKAITIMNVMIVMALGGIWHGAGWNFIFWGVYHGILLICFRVFSPHVSIPSGISIFLTLGLVTIGWFIFRINEPVQLYEFYNSLHHFNMGEFYGRFFKMTIVFGSVLFLIDWLQIRLKNEAFLMEIKNQSLALGIASGLFFICLIYLLVKKPLPFIYFQF